MCWSWRASHASMALAPRPHMDRCMHSSKPDKSSRATTFCGGSWTCCMSATIWISTEGPSAYAETWWRCFPSTRMSAPCIEFFGDEIELISEIDPLRGKVVARPKRAMIYPASHYVATDETIRRAVEGIRGELQERLAHFRREGKLLEAQRLEQRTLFDLEMLEQMGFCHGVENYSRWL